MLYAEDLPITTSLPTTWCHPVRSRYYRRVKTCTPSYGNIVLLDNFRKTIPSRLEFLGATRMVWFRSNTYTETETRKHKYNEREGELRRRIQDSRMFRMSHDHVVSGGLSWALFQCHHSEGVYVRVEVGRVPAGQATQQNILLRQLQRPRCSLNCVWRMCGVCKCIFLSMRKCVQWLPRSEEICQW